ncbi:MAG: 2-keto-4-pentenoate hydratase, partial [Schleiferiaceae bacterium]
MSSVFDHAKALYASLKSGQTIAPLRDHINNDIPTAYAIQQELVTLRMKDGERIVGKKIGLTSPAVQQQLGVDQPDYGILFHTMDRSATGTISMSELMQPKVEGELAFVLGADLPNEDVTLEELKAAIAEVRASIEVVG